MALLDAWTSAAATSLAKSVSAGTDRLLVVVIGAEHSAAVTVTGVTYGDQNMVHAYDGSVYAEARGNAGGGFEALVSIWYLLDDEIEAASGTTITPSFSATPADVVVAAGSYDNMEQAGGTTTVLECHIAETAAATPNPLSVTMGNGVAGDLIVAGATAGNATTYTWTGVSEVFDQIAASSCTSGGTLIRTGTGDVVCAPTCASQNRAGTAAVVFAQATASSSSSSSESSQSSQSSISKPEGTAVWGHHTSVEEDWDRNFWGEWSGDGLILGSGDNEVMRLEAGQSMESITWHFGSGEVAIIRDKYQTGGNCGDLITEYKTAATEAACDAASYIGYTGPFTSLGWIKIRVRRLEGGEMWTYGSIVTLTSGTAHLLASGLPSGLKEIEILLNGVSTNTANQPPVIRLGDAGGIETTGYTSIARVGANTSAQTAYFQFFRATDFAAAEALSGVMRLARWDSSLHLWLMTCLATEAAQISHSTGRKTLSEELTQIQITTPGGAATFDLGSARVRYR